MPPIPEANTVPTAPPLNQSLPWGWAGCTGNHPRSAGFWRAWIELIARLSSTGPAGKQAGSRRDLVSYKDVFNALHPDLSKKVDYSRSMASIWRRFRSGTDGGIRAAW